MLVKCDHGRLRISHGLFSKIFDGRQKPMRRKMIFQGSPWGQKMDNSN